MSNSLPIGWIAVDADDNAASTATQAAPGDGCRHFITSLSGSYSAAAIKLLTLKQGTTVIGRWYVHNAFHIEFPTPVTLEPNTAANAELAASGTGGVTGAVTMTGYTK